jgi:hypothetical protein
MGCPEGRKFKSVTACSLATAVYERASHVSRANAIAVTFAVRLKPSPAFQPGTAAAFKG